MVGIRVGVMARGGSCLSIRVALTSSLALLSPSKLDYELDSTFFSAPASPLELDSTSLSSPLSSSDWPVFGVVKCGGSYFLSFVEVCHLR